ncbi:MAG: 6-pyruvoyl-tetrahydropterin synthase-related protein [Actinomycetota bacterium]|nr:6-pyruvoyl-tetrahydropterin synthase-related protein [Actinomycetota bacterium]
MASFRRIGTASRPELLLGLTSAAVVAAAVVFTFVHLQPGLLFTDNTPAGGDMGAHVWGPAFLRDHLLPAGRLTGWTPDWYAGFPAYHFYMVVPSLAIVALDLVLPYGIAFKLITVSGLLALPVAAWALGRLARLPFPGPPLLAVAAVGFLFDRSFTIYGGNIASTLAGEFAFSISLALAVVFVGLLLRGLETGRHRALAAVALGLCALCHVIPAIFCLVAAAVALLLRPGRARLRWLVTAGTVGALLAAFWAMPFVLRRPYLNDMGWEKLTTYVEHLLPGRLGQELSSALGGRSTAAVPGDLTWVIILAGLGVVGSIVARRRLGIFLTVLAVVFAVAFVLAPQGRLWNARLLPFWYLCLYLLAAIAVSELASAVVALVSRWPDRTNAHASAAVAMALAVAGLGVVALPLRSLPFGRVSDDGASYSWAGIRTTDRSFVPDWARWNYSGYEGKDAYPEYRDVVETMAGVGEGRGCGRAMWEYESELDRYGTPMALMLLPYWTDGCIGSMEGLYFEASATTPYHFLNQAELSAKPSSAQRALPYGTLDVERGVEHLKLLGVRYYMAFSSTAVDAANADPDLTLVADSGPWQVYEVAGSDLVEPLDAEPVVVRGVDEGGRNWLDPAIDWYLDEESQDVFLAADGPGSWARIDEGDDPGRRPVAPVVVSDVRTATDRISFDVDQIGTPVLVKSSYFPNWEASGADGPWRVAPNLMVVVPTERQVELSYGTTFVDSGAWALTVLGLVGLVLLVRRGPVPMPAPPDPPRDDPPAADEGDDDEQEDEDEAAAPAEQRLPVGASPAPPVS